MPLRSNYEEIMVTAAGLSVTVTVTVTVACVFPAATFSLTGTPVGAYMMLAPPALDADVLVTLASLNWRLSRSACGDIAEGCMTGVGISDWVCDAWEIGIEAWLFSVAVTTANNADGIETRSAVVDGTDGELSNLGELFREFEPWTC